MSRPSPVIAVLHRDPQLLVLLKPTGIATTSPDGTRCLAEEARKLDPRAPMVHPTSRLDADVSGVVIFARTREASDALMQARREGRYARTYLAIVERTPEPEEGRWSWPIAIDARDPRLRRALEPGQTGERMQEASSRYAVRARGELASLLSLWPETGRTHQLRVHASRAGSPIVGDTQYGGAAHHAALRARRGARRGARWSRDARAARAGARRHACYVGLRQRRRGVARLIWKHGRRSQNLVQFAR